MSNSDIRPEEIHIKSLSTVERDNLPLIVGMVYGELFAPEAMNQQWLGIISPGIYAGFVPEPKGGLVLSIRRDPKLHYSRAMCQIGIQPFHITQQHDIDLTLTTGYRWVIVLEPFYQPQTKTRQVDISAEHDAVSIKAVLNDDLLPEHQIICEVDLTAGEMTIVSGNIDLTRRNNRAFSIGQHIEADDPHPQYAKKNAIDKLVETIFGSMISQDYNGDSDTKPVSERALKRGLGTKAASSHQHNGEEISKATYESPGVIVLTNSYSDDSEDKVPTAQALVKGLAEKAASTHSHSASDLPSASETDSGIVRLSNSYQSTSSASAATSKALSTGLSKCAKKTHSHESADLPMATTERSGIILLSNQSNAKSENTVPTSNAMHNGLLLKGDKNDLVESDANVTITRGGQKTTLVRNTADPGSVTLDMSTFAKGDEIQIITAHPQASSLNVVANSGKIYNAEGGSDTKFIMNGTGRILLICIGEDNCTRIIENTLS